MRGKICRIYRVGLFVSLATALLATSWGDGEIILLDGSRIAVQRYEIKDKHIVFMTVEGKLQSLPLVYVDLLATTGKKEFPEKSLTRKPNPKPEDYSVAQSTSADPRNPQSELTTVVDSNVPRRASVRAIPLSEPLEVDGQLEESVYTRIDATEGFLQQEPFEGKDATEKTEVWVFFDSVNLYISARLTHSDPERIVASEMRRDHRNIWSQNDSFSVVLDTFYDQRNGYLFRTNPLGALFDAQITDERNINSDWNTIWFVETSQTANGWVMEMALPFKSLRFSSGKSQIWGINFQRLVKWNNERTHLTLIPAAFDRMGILKLSFAADMVGLEVPESYTRMEVKPYLTGSLNTNRTIEPMIANQKDGDVGFDAKYGLTEGLTFDFTYNTDFAQVEDDEAQVNLTRFSLFFPEKREFFLEGQGIFNFGGRDTRPFSFDGPSDMPVMFFSRRIGLSGRNAIPILAGGRLTGRAGPYSIGLLNITTNDVTESAVPRTNFSVVRLKRDIFNRSNVGFIGTYRDNNAENTGSAATYGVDGNFTFFENLNMNAYYARSITPKPEKNGLSYRTSLEYDSDSFGLAAEHLLVDSAFSPGIGFVRRENLRKSSASTRYSIRPSWFEAVRKFDFEGRYDYYERADTGMVETKTTEFESRARLESGDFVNVTYNRNVEVLFDSFEISDGIFVPMGNYSFDRVRGGVWFGGHRRLSGWIGAEVGGFLGGSRTELTYRGRVEFSSKFFIEPHVSMNWIKLAQGSFTTSVFRIRGNYTISPRSYIGGLFQYNSAAGLFSTNIRFRWEYRPGSDIFFVYSDGRDMLVGNTPFLENRSVIVKFTRLFRF